MQISRTKNVVIMEIEESDCPLGLTTEMQADLIEKGLRAQMKFLYKAVERALQSPEIIEAGEKVIADWKERWEIT